MEVRDFLRQRVGGELTEAEERILGEMGEGKVIDFLGERQVDMRQKVDREAAQAWAQLSGCAPSFCTGSWCGQTFRGSFIPRGLLSEGCT